MKKLIAFLIVLSSMLVASNCHNNRGIPRPAPFTEDDPSFCAAGCEHIGPEGLGCPEGELLVYPNDECSVSEDCAVGDCVQGYCAETCEQFCVASIENGRWMGAECWQTIKECSEIETECRR